MKKSVYLFFLLIIPVFLPAQTAGILEELFNTKILNYEQAAWLVLEAANIWDHSETAADPEPREAYSVALDQKWIPADTGPGDNARLDRVSLLLMQSFGLKGGIFYSWTQNPHYAYRELVYQDIIQGRSDPEMTVSGEMLLFLVNVILSRLEAADWSPVLSVRPGEFTMEQNIPGQEIQGQNLREPIVPEPPAPTPQISVPNPYLEQQRQALAEHIISELGPEVIDNTSVKVTSEGVTISLSNIQFSANSSELPEEEKHELEEIARVLRTIPNRRILIAGHTALSGTAEDRMQTSLQRAQAVKDYLVMLGARNPDEIIVQGFGAERPIASNITIEGMALNRRVEITILEN